MSDPTDFSMENLPTPAAGKECTHAHNCSLFPLFKLESTNAVWRTFYCFGDFTRCARYQVAAEGKPMPLTLLPNGKWLDNVPEGT